MTLICGIDEAGRGPVIGPLVMAGILIDEKDEDKLKEIGVKDSKLLTPKKRTELAKEIRKLAKEIHVIKISPQEIDSRKAVGINLNILEALKAADIINILKPYRVYIDSPTSPDETKFAHMIRKYLQHETEIESRHYADKLFPCVAAASIIAKTQRDEVVEEIKKEIGFEFGSGYAADEITKDFLAKNHEAVLKHMRKSWGTYKNLMKKKEQKSLDEF